MTDQSNGGAIVERKHPIVVLRERLDARINELKAAAPPDIPPERIIRALITAAQIDPNLLACRWDSLWLALMRACRDGLLPDGREGAIVAYKDKAQWIPMYQGLIKKFAQSGHYKAITANCVFEGDEFEHWIDENGEHLKHRPNEHSDIDPAKINRVYALANSREGGVFIAVLPRAEIDKIRKVSRTTREDAPWNMWFSEMAKKTALRRLSKLLPTGPVLPDEYDEDEPEGAPKLAVAPAPRERGAAAALDMFASSPTDTAAVSTPPHAAPEGEDDGVQADHGPPQDMDQSAAADRSEPDPVSIAYLRGRESKNAKHARSALPGEYRSKDRDIEAQAWLAGYDGKPKPTQENAA
jgi:recombination protein RecT